MSSKGQHVQDNSVVERRLRPIYDWLDVGHNKKALQECEKVLKKTPALQCAKALKAVTLHRLGKEADAVQMLTNLAKEQPTDDSTLQAMTLCYRELDQLPKICELYDTAIRLDPLNEELHTHLFMSYVRVFDFKAQQKVAMSLFKHKPKTPYYCWAVMSIILQATRGDGKNDAQKKQLLLSLAERMMEKMISDGKLDAEQEIQLYILILELQAKFEQILQIFEGPLGEKLACSNPPQNRIKYLVKLGRYSEINAVCKAILLEKVNSWDIWLEYINSVFELYANGANNHETSLDDVDDSPEKAHEFICRIIELDCDDSKTNNLQRGPYLARFELVRKMQPDERAKLMGETTQLFIEYFRKFAHKPCCVNDLRKYLLLLTADQQIQLSQRLLQEVGLESQQMPSSEKQMQSHLCALQLSRLCNAHRHLQIDEMKSLVCELIQRYQHGHEQYGRLRLATDLGPADAYKLLAVHILYDLAQVQHDSSVIIVAIWLLTNLLRNSPSNFHAKLLAVKLYSLLGGCLGANKWYTSLDMKHLQLDSMGFVHCERLATSGMYDLCTQLFDVTLKFFSSNYKDSCDHITFSYKYGSFIKLDEFMDFRERLNNSMHYTTIAIDRIILSLVECNNLDGLYNINISPKDDKIEWENLRDNHDLSVYISWDSERITQDPEDYAEIRHLFQQNISFLKLRASILWCFSIAMEILKSRSSDEATTNIQLLSNQLAEWHDWYEQIRKSPDLNVPLKQNLIGLPLPSRLHALMALPQYEIVSNLFRLFLHLARIKCGKNEEAVEKNEILLVISTIEKGLQELIELIRTRLTSDEFNQNLMRRRESLEYVTNSVEILSISMLLSVLCQNLVKKSNNSQENQHQQHQQQQKSRKSKKKSNLTQPNDVAPTSTNDCSTNNHVNFNEILSNLGKQVKLQLNEFSKLLDQWSLTNQSDDLINLITMLNLNRDKDNDVLNEILDNLSNSYGFAVKEMQIVLKSKRKMMGDK